MKEIDLLNKKVLYIGPISFHYDKYIIKKVSDLGAKVDTYDAGIFYPNGYIEKFIIKVNKTYEPKKIDSFYKSILSKNGYDYILIRHSPQIQTDFLQKLRTNNPSAKFINFHWDSLRPAYDYTKQIQYFDKVFSFDVKDCENNAAIHYLPLFFIDEYDEFRKNSLGENTEKKYDLLFIGSWRDNERVQLINNTESLCKASKLSFCHYLYLPFIDQLRSLKRGIIPKKARSKSLTHSEILSLFSDSNVIIDFPSSFQTGLTMRTFETLGAGKKLITTNRNILKEPFYNPEFINVVDLGNLKLDIDFIKSKPKIGELEGINDYSIGSYLNKLFA